MPSKQPTLRKNWYEQQFWLNNQLIAGIDESGRGCLAGPVVAAAVILPPRPQYRKLKDSKILSKQELLKLYEWIIRHAWYGIGIADHAFIDKVNIYQATMFAMHRAVSQLLATAPRQPSALLIDAMPLYYKSFQGNTYYFDKGESKSSSIAAASIVAKITRDRIMQKISRSFPAHKLEQHKGYGTLLHKTCIKTASLSLIHRHSFIKVTNEAAQIGLFEVSNTLNPETII